MIKAIKLWWNHPITWGTVCKTTVAGALITALGCVGSVLWDKIKVRRWKKQNCKVETYED